MSIIGFKLTLLLRILKLKIKFSFYDLPCSFPIRHSVVFSFLSCRFIVVVVVAVSWITCPFRSRAQNKNCSPPLSFFLVLFVRRIGGSLFSSAQMRWIPDTANTARQSKNKRTVYYSMFDWPKFLGANHNLQLRNKGQTESETHEVHTNGDWIRRKNKTKNTKLHLVSK